MPGDRSGEHRKLSRAQIIVSDVNTRFSGKVRALVLGYPLEERNGKYQRFPRNVTPYGGY